MIIGTRGSRLALKQVEIFLSKTNLDAEIKIIRTSGDKSKKNIKELSIGIFTKELDNALINNEIDLAIHSLKDIPTVISKELDIAGVVERADARDCIVSKGNKKLDEIKKNAIIGTDSERRKAEILNLRNDLKIKEIRGNIDTRLKKVENGLYDAIILAKCALDRLNLQEKISEVFDVQKIVPAAGQGAIAIVKRKKYNFDFPEEFRKNYLPCELERCFIKDLGGCRNPVGAYCTDGDDDYHLIGLFYKNNKRNLIKFNGNFEKIKKDILKWKKEEFT